MIRALSYIGFASPNADAWRRFAPEVLGAELAADGPDGAVRLRVDDAVARIAVHPGERDDLAYLGWDVGGAAELDAAVSRLAGVGIVAQVDADLADGRGVAGLAWFVDPFGFRHELTHDLRRGAAPFRPGRPMAGFVTGDAGLGHVVLLVPDVATAEVFFVDVLGFRLSDTIEQRGRLRFLHCNERHHTVAFAGAPGMVGMHHLMLEVTTIDDVGAALDIVNEREIPLAMGLGRHTNDLMTSFYVRTPSGFEIEYGHGGRLVDDATWEPTQYDAQSIWGHKPPATGRLRPSILRPYEPAGAPA